MQDVKNMNQFVGIKIKNLRLSRGETLEEFGKLFGATRGNVALWEKGSSLPSPSRLKILAALLNTTVEDLLGENCGMCIKNDFKVGWYAGSDVELSAWYSVTSDKKLMLTLSDSKGEYLGFIDIDIKYCPECGRKLG